jgi:hypothetical protein
MDERTGMFTGVVGTVGRGLVGNFRQNQEGGVVRYEDSVGR